MASLLAVIFLIASIILEISPPDAVFTSGFSGSPLFVEIRISTSSRPFSSGLDFGSNRISSAAPEKLRSFSSINIFSESS